MNPGKVVIGFLPLLVFPPLITVLGVGGAAAAALAVAVVVIAATCLSELPAVPVAQGVIFLVMEFVGFGGDPPLDDVLTRYGPALAALLLSLFILVGAQTAPFTAKRAAAAPGSRRAQGVHAEDRRVSTAWGFAVLVISLGHVLGALVYAGGLLPSLIFDAAVPLVALWSVAVHSGRAAAPVGRDQTQRAGGVIA